MLAILTHARTSIVGKENFGCYRDLRMWTEARLVMISIFVFTSKDVINLSSEDKQFVSYWCNIEQTHTTRSRGPSTDKHSSS